MFLNGQRLGLQVIVALLLLLAPVSTVCAQGILDAVRKEVSGDRKQEENNSSHHNSGHHDDYHSHHDSNFQYREDSDAYEYNHRDRSDDSLGEEVDLFPELNFARYPYADHHDGFILPEGWMEDRSNEISKRIWFEYGNDFENLSRWTGRFFLEGSRIALGGSWNSYLERLPTGANDQLNVGDLYLYISMIETPHFHARIGVGFNWLGSGVTYEDGEHFAFRIDAYPFRPLVINGSMEVGGLGETDLFHGQVTVGLIYDRVEIFCGYDYRRIGSIELESPMFGARIWF